MNQEDTRRALMNSISSVARRNWESPEKNNKAAELSRRVQDAMARQDQGELSELALEMRHFMAPTFTLFERVSRLTREQANKKWSKSEDETSWRKLVERARIVVTRRDSEELVQVAERLVAFLRQRNGHVLAQSLEEAMRMTKRAS